MVSVIIEPFEPIVNEAIQLIESKLPGFFSGIGKIVVEQGDAGHFGRVESDKPDTIYVSMGRIRNALSAATEEQRLVEIALTLAHEVGHIRSNFTGGEAPALSEEEKVKSILSSRLVSAKLLRTAGLEPSGVSDSGSGKQIYVSTSVRIGFRGGNQGYKKMKNDEVNRQAANLFSKSSITARFRPRSGNDKGAKGQVRDGQGVKFIGIEYPERISIVAIKANSVSASSSFGDRDRLFIRAHLVESIMSKHGLIDTQVEELVKYLSLFNNKDELDILADVDNEQEINKLYRAIQEKNRYRDRDFQEALPHDTFSLPAGIPLREPVPSFEPTE